MSSVCSRSKIAVPARRNRHGEERYGGSLSLFQRFEKNDRHLTGVGQAETAAKGYTLADKNVGSALHEGGGGGHACTTAVRYAWKI